MPSLVPYASDSSSDSETPTPAPSPHKKTPVSSSTAPPPPPPSFTHLYATAPRPSTTDDPSLHAGRTRTYRHQPGRWPTHVQVEWSPDPSAIRTLEALIEALPAPPGVENPTSLLRSSLGAALPLHISLSGTLLLRNEQRGAFVTRIRQMVRGMKEGKFEVRGVDARWVGNSGGERVFLVVGLERDVRLKALLGGCNAVAGEFGLEGLYTGDEGGEEGGGGAKEGQEEDEEEEEGKRRAKRRKTASYTTGTTSTTTGETRSAADARCHVSIAWALPGSDSTAATAMRAESSFDDFAAQDGDSGRHSEAERALIRRVVVPVSSIKIKSGNTVEEIALGGADTDQSTGSWLGFTG